MQQNLRLNSLWALLPLALAMAGCMYAPTDGELVNIGDTIQFQGYTRNPGATVMLYSLNKGTNDWDVITFAVSSTSPTTYNGDTLYAWGTSFNYYSLPNYDCYWGDQGTCIIDNSNSAYVKAVEINGSLQGDDAPLTTFDDEGVDCVIDGLQAGESWYAAGQRCQDDDTPIVWLHDID